MISRVDNNNLPMLEGFLSGQKNIYSCRIECLLRSYGLKYDFCAFHIQTDINGNVTSAAAKYYSDMTVCLTENSDTDELSEFIMFSGFSSLLCSKALPFGVPSESGIIMELKRDVPEKILSEGMKHTFSPDLKAVWELLKSCEDKDFAVPQYEDFLLDMSHKLRHGTAHCAAVCKGEKIVSAAMTVSESESCALIGAVATDKSFRRMGIGSSCVSELCRGLKDKKIFIMRDQNKNESFYSGLGFENKEKYYLYKKER